jgi:hypothetical protein
MGKCRLPQGSFLVLLFLTFARPAPAAKDIKIEIVNLTWTISADGIASYHAKAILPDGDRLILVCDSGESECAKLPSAAPKNSGCDREHMVVTCRATDLGYFSARREGNDILFYVPTGKLTYHIAGSSRH